MLPEPTTSTERAGLLHEALFYRGREELEDALREFFDSAAQAAEPVLAVLPGSHLQWLREALPDSGAEVRFEDMQEVGRNPGCLLAVMEEWTDQQDGRARVVTEISWPGRSEAETIECLRHEAIVNLAMAERDVSILCPWEVERMDARIREGVELTHPRLREGGVGCDSDRFDPDQRQVAEAMRWPLAEPVEPVFEHRFTGDLRTLRHAISGHALVRGLDDERRQGLVLAVNEAAANAVMHGDGRCDALLWRHDDHVVCEISSETTITDPFAGRRRPDPLAASGRGLWLINHLCDLVELRSAGGETRIRMHVAC